MLTGQQRGDDGLHLIVFLTHNGRQGFDHIGFDLVIDVVVNKPAIQLACQKPGYFFLIKNDINHGFILISLKIGDHGIVESVGKGLCASIMPVGPKNSRR